MDHAIDRSLDQPAPSNAPLAFERRVHGATGLQLIFGGMVFVLGLVVPALLIAGAAGSAHSAPPASFVISLCQVLGLIGIVVGVPIIAMGLIKFAREVWRS